MSDVVKNPNRNRPRPVEIRTPEYERLGINPTTINPNNYARPESLLPIAFSPGKTPLSPDTISEVDGASFDQEGKRHQSASKKDSHIIDNNEFLNFGFSSEKEMSEAIENGDFIDLDSNKTEESMVPDVGQYILMISGKIIMCGSLDVIEEKVKSILYGEDLDFELSKVPQEDIIVLKRVDIQVGVFIKD
jgi:hypothetical protein